MSEEAAPAAVEPPDIRPCRRIHLGNNDTQELHDVNSNTAISPVNIIIAQRRQRQDIASHHSASSHLQRNRPFRITLLNSSTFLILAIVTAALLPVGHAQQIAQDDPYTSYPVFGSVYGSSWSWETGYTDNKSRPLLSFLSWIVSQVFTLLQYVTGIDVPSALSKSIGHIDGGLAKRVKTEIIVEAIMIPVLVVLSGVFAGLTLG